MKSKRLFRIDWSKKGLNTILSPENTELETLTVASLSLEKDETYTISFEDEEFMLSIIKGIIEVQRQKSEQLTVHDVIFGGPKTEATIKALSEKVYGIVASAPSTIEPVLKVVKLKDVIKDPNLYKVVGEENCTRDVITMIGDNIKAARLIAGYTWVRKGNWSSWPPHEHGDKMEEVYIFYELPAPGYGLQLVYETYEDADIFLVRENDIVVIPRGYHPNVVAPGFGMKYLWIISAKKAFEDRIYGAWRTHPDFQK